MKNIIKEKKKLKEKKEVIVKAEVKVKMLKIIKVKGQKRKIILLMKVMIWKLKMKKKIMQVLMIKN